MNKIPVRKILLIIYAFIAGALFGGAFAFFVINPLLQVLLSIITGGRDTGPNWLINLINVLFILSIVVSVFGGIYISEKWCLNYLSKKNKS